MGRPGVERRFQLCGSGKSGFRGYPIDRGFHPRLRGRPLRDNEADRRFVRPLRPLERKWSPKKYISVVEEAQAPSSARTATPRSCRSPPIDRPRPIWTCPKLLPTCSPRIQAALISPTYKSGTLYASDILRRYRVTGKLAGANGVVVGYVAGDLVDQAGTNLTSTFTDENGDFEIYDLVPGSYTIVWPDYIGTTTFELAETSDGLLFPRGTVVPNKANEAAK